MSKYKGNKNPAASNKKTNGKGDMNPGVEMAPTEHGAHNASNKSVRKATAHNHDMNYDGGISKFDAGGKGGTKE